VEEKLIERQKTKVNNHDLAKHKHRCKFS
jgi:hypothetical protein